MKLLPREHDKLLLHQVLHPKPFDVLMSNSAQGRVSCTETSRPGPQAQQDGGRCAYRLPASGIHPRWKTFGR